MNTIYYIGMDIHKKTISYCVKKIDGTMVQQGKIAAERKALHEWMAGLPQNWGQPLILVDSRKIEMY